MAARDKVEYRAKFRIGFDVSCGPVAFALNPLHIGRSEAEEEAIIRTDLLPHLHIGTIERPNGECTIEHKFHIAGARGLFAGRGDLLLQLAPGLDEARILDL